MKTLFLVRHAKSSWADIALDDFDRPLNNRGEKDTPLMGNVLKNKQILRDLLLSSPAKRAYSTAKKIAKAIGYTKDDIQTNKNIYHASADSLLEIMQGQDENYQSIMLFGHNPGLTDFAVMLSGKPIENIPTCGIVCIDFNIKRWNQLIPEDGIFKFLDYPKNYK